MATYNIDAIQTPDGNVYSIKDNISGYTSKTGTMQEFETYGGITGGPITSSGTVKCRLKSETKSSLTAASKGSTSNREYPVGIDNNGNLSANVTWFDTTFSALDHIQITSSKAINVVKIGDYYYKTDTVLAVVPSGSTQCLARTQDSLPAGTYFVCGTITWGGQSRNGKRTIWISSSDGGGNINNFCRTSYPAYNTNTGEPIVQQVHALIKRTSAGLIYLNGNQNSGTSINCSNHGIAAVRLS